jgi:hypothetical protein
MNVLEIKALFCEKCECVGQMFEEEDGGGYVCMCCSNTQTHVDTVEQANWPEQSFCYKCSSIGTVFQNDANPVEGFIYPHFCCSCSTTEVVLPGQAPVQSAKQYLSHWRGDKCYKTFVGSGSKFMLPPGNDFSYFKCSIEKNMDTDFKCKEPISTMIKEQECTAGDEGFAHQVTRKDVCLY